MSEETTDPRFYELRDAAFFDLPSAQGLVAVDPTIIEARNSIGETAFHFLVVEDALDGARWLLDHGSDINTRNTFGATPLMEAASLGYLGMCRFLLERGADFRVRDNSGDTAISEAAQGGNTGVLEMLLDCLDAAEDINAFFSSVTAHMLFAKKGRAAALARGLQDPWRE